MNRRKKIGNILFSCGIASVSEGCYITYNQDQSAAMRGNGRACHFGGGEKAAFICVHNSCRSKIAEALGKHVAKAVFESCSGGTETKPGINSDAVRLMKKLYSIDMEKTQRSRLLKEIPAVDVVITMGCSVSCLPFRARSGRAGDVTIRRERPMKRSWKSCGRSKKIKSLIEKLREG